jgi:hypothetical protein
MIHRHLDVPPDTPVAEMPLAVIHDLLERGDLEDWRPLLRALARQPWGDLADRVARLVDVYPMYGTSPLLRAWIERCRCRANALGGAATEPLLLCEARRQLGKTQVEIARRMGISQSDFSKLERRRDRRLSTLSSAARALGGRLRVFLSMPDREIELDIADPPETKEGPRRGG